MNHFYQEKKWLGLMNQEKFFRIPPDNRLNYDKFFVEGKEILSKSIEYTSHNTKRLDIEEIIEILLKLDFIKDALAK